MKIFLSNISNLTLVRFKMLYDIVTIIQLKTILLPCIDVKTEATAKINTNLYLQKHTLFLHIIVSLSRSHKTNSLIKLHHV